MFCLTKNTTRVRRCQEVASEVSEKWDCSVAKFQQFKLRTDTDSVQGPRSELTKAELQCHQRVLLTERHVRFPRILSLWCSKEVKNTDTGEKSSRLSRHSTLTENVLIKADESRHVMTSLMEPTGEVVDERILENPVIEDRKLLESRAKKNMTEFEEFSFE